MTSFFSRFMQERAHEGIDPGTFLSTLNSHLHSLLESDEFATMFYGIIDTDANCLLYATAASQPAILYTSAEPDPVLLQGRGFPMGVISNATYETQYTPFTIDNMLLLYSDCLVETKNKHGKYIMEQHIKELISAAMKEAQENPAKHVVDLLKQLLHAHQPDYIEDDITINAYWRRLE